MIYIPLLKKTPEEGASFWHTICKPFAMFSTVLYSTACHLSLSYIYIFSVQFTRRKTNSIFYLHPLNRQLKTKMKWLKEICFVQIFKMKKCIYDHVTKFDTMIRICIVEIAINLRYNVLWIWINNIFFCILFNVYALHFGHSNVCISL